MDDELLLESEFSESFNKLLTQYHELVQVDFGKITSRVLKNNKGFANLGQLAKDRQLVLNSQIADCIKEIKNYIFAKSIIRAIINNDDKKLIKEISRIIRTSGEIELKSYAVAMKRQTLEIATQIITYNLGIQSRELPETDKEYKSMDEFFETIYKTNFGRWGGALKACLNMTYNIQQIDENDNVRTMWEKIEESVKPLVTILGIPKEHGSRKYSVQAITIVTLMMHLMSARGIKFESLVKSFNKIEGNDGVVTDEMIDRLNDNMVEFGNLVSNKLLMNEHGKLKIMMGNHKKAYTFPRNSMDHEGKNFKRALDNDSNERIPNKRIKKVVSHSTDIKNIEDSNMNFEASEDSE